ncbi:MAG: sensor histidine kinase, partial [Candidatus Binatia bacterium]
MAGIILATYLSPVEKWEAIMKTLYVSQGPLQIRLLRDWLEAIPEDSSQPLAEAPTTKAAHEAWREALHELFSCQAEQRQLHEYLKVSLKAVEELQLRSQDREEELRQASDEFEQRVNEHAAQLVAVNDALRREIVARQERQAQIIENERLAVLGVTAEKVAHEIGNTLNNLATSVQLQRYHLKSQPWTGDATLAAIVQDLQTQLQRLNTIVRAWRSLAQQSHLSLQPTPLAPLITEELETHARRSISQGITVVLDISADLPLVNVDREKLQRALGNVWTNALAAMPTGGTLTIRVSHSEKDVIIEVQDTGPGVPEG